MKTGDLVKHPSHEEEVGTVGHVWSDGTFNVFFEDGEFSFDDYDNYISARIKKDENNA